MKIAALVVVGLALVPGSYALAAQPAATGDTGPGCGLGKMFWENNKKVIPQVLAAATNGTFGSQTFGITSGTSGCTNDGIVMNDQKVSVFASAAFENLKQEMAQGQGEYLSSLATLMGIPSEYHGEFSVAAQESYLHLFKSENTTPSEMLTALRQELLTHPVLSQVVIRQQS